MAGKQAKIATDSAVKMMLAACETHRYPIRDKVIVLLSYKAGLRACEIAGLTWPMVMSSDGEISEMIEVRDSIAKKSSGRTIPMHPDLRVLLGQLEQSHPEGPVVFSERGGAFRPMRPTSVVNLFAKLYSKLGLQGCSSHSGRRTFITKSAKKASSVGASLRDIQQMVGHRSLATTQRYIEGDTEAKKNLIKIV